MNASLHILSTDLLAPYCEQISEELLATYAQLSDSELSTDDFGFYTSVSAVFSSKIEGEDIELDSYVKHRRFGVKFQLDYTRKIDDLYEAYDKAKVEKLKEENLKSAHACITRHILPKETQGEWRSGHMFVTTPDGRIEYVAASGHEAREAMDRFFEDVDTLMSSQFTLQETFFFAALLHLVFVKIHPFEDGNGRTGRLLEKWFLVEKLGDQAWLIPSERYYYQHHATYYRHLRQLGIEYAELDYSKALPFLTMLPHSITTNPES